MWDAKRGCRLVELSRSSSRGLILSSPVRLTPFTGSSRVAEHLSKVTAGKVKIEDAGFDCKILGPDVESVDYVAWQSVRDGELVPFACFAG